VSLLLIRHAMAGHRKQWTGDDRVRPLDEQGRREAEGLIELLADHTLDRIVTSPYTRCVQTVEPLADARGLTIELDHRLGADRLHDVPLVLADLKGQDAAVCTHGELPWLVKYAFEKGATWVMGEDLAPERYLPPPT
jgi:8-oxo-dGTP diphosphatase